MALREWAGLASWLAASFGAAAVGNIFGPGPWYEQLEKPEWTPPDVAFPVVWTTLYVLMGVAAWLVWRRWGFRGARLALALFLVQLVLNAAWSWIFFGLERPAAAFFELLLLWLAILGTAVAFWRRSRAAGALLLPYLAWVTFAGALNLAIWRLNA